MKPYKPLAFVANTASQQETATTAALFENFASDLFDLDPAMAQKLPTACTIELDKMKQYIEYLEQELTAKGVKNKGIKFVFGQYGAPGLYKDMNPLYEGLIHIFCRPADMLALANGDYENPPESDADSKLNSIASLNYMHITPPWGVVTEPEGGGSVGSGSFGN